jgi:hypothetical protein
MDTVELITTFCGVPTRKALYDFVAAKSSLTFLPSQSDIWHSKTAAGETTIWYSPTANPEACLAHELLHANLKLNGYKQYCVSVCDTPKRAVIAPLLSMLDNELQHHKFYPEFLTLGFAEAEMYHDSDSDVREELRATIAALRSNDQPEEFLRAFITIIAPGGSAPIQERVAWARLLEDKSPARYWRRLQTVREAFSDFAQSYSLDAGPTIIRILRALGGYDPTWIGPSEDGFPNEGYFVETPFEWERPMTDNLPSQVQQTSGRNTGY